MVRKKILHITPYYLPQYGGIEQVTYDIVNILKENYENKIICFSETKKTKIDKYEGIEVHRIGWLKKIASQAISFSYFFRLKKLLKEFQPDFIHLHLPNPLITVYLLVSLYFYKKEIKIIGHWHSDIIEQKFLKKLYNPIQSILLKKLEKIIVTSKEYGMYSEDLKNYQNKIVVIPNIVNERLLIELKNETKIGKIKEKYKNKKIIFFIGVHRKYKGLKYLIEASKYLSNEFKIIIAGSGPLTEELKELSNNDSKIEFMGKISDEDKVNYYYASDIFAFPSITKNEALYCGLPAVTFTIKGSGVNWVNLDGITGIEVKKIDANEFSKGIKKVSKSKKYRITSKIRTKQLFSSKILKKEINHLYDYLLEEKYEGKNNN